jgi:hypothetical protein
MAVVTAGAVMALYYSTTLMGGISLLFGGTALVTGGSIAAGFTFVSLGIGATMAAGFCFGFSAAVYLTLLNGGNIGYALENGVKGGVTGALTSAAMFEIDAYAPDWFEGKMPKENEKWFTPQRVARQMERISARATVNGASSALSGGSFKDGFSSAALWDCVKCTTEVMMEWRYRWECSNNNVRNKEFDDYVLSRHNNSWATATEDAQDKLPNESVVAPWMANVGKPIGSTSLVWTREDGTVLSFLAKHVPEMNNLGLLHDYWATTITIPPSCFFVSTINTIASVGTIPPYIVLDYAILTNNTLTNFGMRSYAEKN